MKSFLLSSKFIATAIFMLLFAGSAAAQSQFTLFHSDHILLYIVGVIFVLAFTVVRLFKRMEKKNSFPERKAIVYRRRRQARNQMLMASGIYKK